jgi:hypothetical protein
MFKWLIIFTLLEPTSNRHEIKLFAGGEAFKTELECKESLANQVSFIGETAEESKLLIQYNHTTCIKFPVLVQTEAS